MESVDSVSRCCAAVIRVKAPAFPNPSSLTMALSLDFLVAEMEDDSSILLQCFSRYTCPVCMGFIWAMTWRPRRCP